MGILLGGLTDRGYSERAMGRFMREMLGVRLCVKGAARCYGDESSVAEAYASGRSDDLVVEVDETGMLSYVNLVKDLSGKVLDMLGEQRPACFDVNVKQIYDYTFNFVETLTKFLPQYSPISFLVLSLAQNYKPYLESYWSKCSNIWDIANLLGADQYYVLDTPFYGYRDQDRVFLKPPRGNNMPDTLGSNLLGIVEVGLYLWRLRLPDKWFRVDRSPYSEFINWVKQSLGGYKPDLCANGYLILDGKKVVSCGTCAMPNKKVVHVEDYFNRLGPFLLFRFVGIRVEKEYVIVSNRNNSCNLSL
ncbi:MAG: hypothetical protein ACP5IE_03475 [Infirmifilum sp.]